MYVTYYIFSNAMYEKGPSERPKSHKNHFVAIDDETR